jgi:hypothetical protein
MSTISRSPTVSRLPDADMQAVPAALVRAAQRAQELAARTGTPLVVTQHGKLIEKPVIYEPKGREPNQ